MKTKIKNDDGTETEVDVIPTEEANKKVEEVQKEHETKLAEKDTALSTLAQEKADLEKKLQEAAAGGEKGKEDHPNFKVLKEALEKKDKEMADLKNEIATDKKTAREEDMKNRINKVAKGNAELEKKIQFNLTNTLAAMKENTQEERELKFNAALKLSADSMIETPGIFDNGAGGGGGGGRGEDFSQSSGGPEFTKREKLLGAKLGITDADYKKYGPRIGKK